MTVAWRSAWQVVFIAWAGVAGTADAQILSANPVNYHALVHTLKLGDRLQLAAGDYMNGLPVHHLSSLPQLPIVIAGMGAPERAVFHARSGANTVSIVDSAYVEIRDLVFQGYNLQIKHQTGRASVPGMPVTARQTIIRHNVFNKAQNTSSGQLTRPNVLVGHRPLAGNGADIRYQIYANFFYYNPIEALFQGKGNIALYNNIFVNPATDAVHIQPHHGIPRNIVIAYNTSVASGDGVRLLHRLDTPVADMAFTHNLIFADRTVAGLTDAGNLAQDYAGPRRK